MKIKNKDKKAQASVEKIIIKNCDTCGTHRGYGFYGTCAHCDANYSNWCEQPK